MGSEEVGILGLRFSWEALAMAVDEEIRHARIELPAKEYADLRRAADLWRLPVAAYIRMAVMERIRRDSGLFGTPVRRKGGGKGER